MSINKELENLELDLSELSSLELMSKRENVKKLLKSEINKVSQKRNDLLKQLKDFKELTNNGDNGSQQTVGQSLGSVIVSNYMWDQNDDFVKIYVEIEPNYCLEESTIQLSFANKKGFSIIFGKYKFTINNLHSDVDNEKSYHKLTKSGKRLIIYLKKVSPKHWTTIKTTETKNKYKKALEEEKEELSGDPSAGLMKLMKQMYNEGDDDMKRTIAKSWYESRQKNTGDMTSLDPDMTDI